jgi:predicted ArsR family transcriptional regulator
MPLFYTPLHVKMENMTGRDVLRADPTTGAILGESRARVLSVLQAAGTALGVVEVAERVDLHPNTARFHLDALVDAGLAERASEGRDQPGRPRMLYTASAESGQTGRRSYRLLAEILTSYVAAQTPQPAKAAVKAGQAWGRYLAERPAPFQRIDAAVSTQQLVRTLEEIGFAPEAVTSGRKRRILLHHCPFREVAEEHGEVVCSIHLGVMQGLLTELDAPLEAQRLEPFVEPSLCVAHLAPRKGAQTPSRQRAN